jgi:GT2 family glycosyltransferase
MIDATVVVPTVNGAPRLRRLLRSLTPTEHQIVVVDNGSSDGTAEMIRREFAGIDLLELDRNVGFGRATNAGAERAEGQVLVLLNNDCVCAPGFIAALTAALDPGDGVVMAASVMVEASNPGVIDSAGMELDSTLLVFDYLNGKPVSILDRPVADPVGPSAAAAAFDGAAFREAGGFDERLFAYWEDVDLVLRLRLLGGTCSLALGARGSHAHSATFGAGSPKKNFAMGFGRGYVLRKWGVTAPSRLPSVLARELPICAGQAVVDRNVAGIRGRLQGFVAAERSVRRPYPRAALLPSAEPRLARTLLARARRRARLRQAAREAA